MLKINKLKPQLNKKPEGGALTPSDRSRAHRRNRLLFFFLARTQPMKSWDLFVYEALPASFTFCKRILLLCDERNYTWLSWLQTPNCSSLLTPNKPVFAGEIFGGLFVSGQHFQPGCVRDANSFIAILHWECPLFFWVNNDLSFEETNHFLHPASPYRCYLNSLCRFHT